MLDVAACAERLIDCAPARFERLAASLELECDALRRALVLLVALHDAGKFSKAFAKRIGNGEPAGLDLSGVPTHKTHWQLSFALLAGPLDGLLAPELGSRLQTRWHLYASVAGHHGRPPVSGDAQIKLDEGAEAARAFTSDLLGLFPGPGLALGSSSAVKRLTWHLAGLVTTADWLGSNQRWFPYTHWDTPLAGYLEIARERAAAAIAAAGLESAPIAPAAGVGSLFDIVAPRPMQSVVQTTALPDGPVLALIEDATGAGKTEAALALAHRMMASGKGAGLYLALPTMATANAMFDRLSSAYRRLYVPGAPPSLALAHGRREHHEGFRQAAEGLDRMEGLQQGAEDSTAAACAEWIADDRRKTFLAEVGVGTIDQAILAALPVKFSTLRLWGLGDRILIVDEAHAYDAYMTQELKRLLEFQAALGGSAIVMTATLPAKTRCDLIESYQTGLQLEAAGTVPSQSYPLLTLVSRAETKDRAVDPTPQTVRRVGVERISSAQMALRAAVAAARKGAAVAWVRNAVDDAVAAAEAIAEQDVTVDLFHARFAMADRLAIEADAVQRFGKAGTAADRRGRVLVATQVVEQSLDLDFDVMITDLAPIDLMVQRAGRLWRHMDVRPAAARPVGGPTLVVLSPDPAHVASEDWIFEVLDKGGYVYGHAVLWRSAHALFAAGEIAAPDGLRPLIEAVYGEIPAPVPSPLIPAETRDEGKARAEKATAGLSLLEVEAGYYESEAFNEDRDYPTRLGEPQRTLVLARAEGDRLLPWAGGAKDDTRAWALSEVSARESRLEPFQDGLDQDDPRIAALTAGWPEWRRKSVWVAIVREDGTIAQGLRYDAKWGLRFE